MKFGSRLLVVAIIGMVTLIGSSLSLVGATTSAAATPGFCTNQDGSGVWDCLNDRLGGGSGNVVQSWGAGATNENFFEQSVSRCGGNVTQNCPFANTTFDKRYLGFPIYQLKYAPNGLCVATDSSAGAVLGTCNDPNTGFGGSNGTLVVDHNGFMINLYWTNQGSGVAEDAAWRALAQAPRSSSASRPVSAADVVPALTRTPHVVSLARTWARLTSGPGMTPEMVEIHASEHAKIRCEHSGAGRVDAILARTGVRVGVDRPASQCHQFPRSSVLSGRADGGTYTLISPGGQDITLVERVTDGEGDSPARRRVQHPCHQPDRSLISTVPDVQQSANQPASSWVYDRSTLCPGCPRSG